MIKRISYINIILVFIIVSLGLIQLNYEGETPYERRIRAVLGYFFIVPLLFWLFINVIIVFNFYLKSKFKKPLKYFYLNIPSIIILLYILYVLICISIEVMFRN